MKNEGKILAEGLEAIGYGAINAGCTHFFGYPITPQNLVPEWFSRELPKQGGVFVQAQSETGAINMVLGASSAGARTMTSTSGPGWALMLETMSHLSGSELPCVVVLVQRGGFPGWYNVMQAQSDYFSATRGGGGGGYRTIVLAPASVQETHDLLQLAFHLADKYRNPSVVLTDAVVGQTAEPLELKKLDFGPLSPKDWAVRGKGYNPDGKSRHIGGSHYRFNPSQTEMQRNLVQHAKALAEKVRLMEANEVRYESHHLEDARLVLVAYGYCSRISREAVNAARREGLKVGMLRPITLWPFPSMIIGNKAKEGAGFLVVEDSYTGQMLEDVDRAAQGRSQVGFLGFTERDRGDNLGAIIPSVVLDKIKKLYDREAIRG